MEIYFKTSKLNNICNDFKKANRELGQDNARLLLRRLDNLSAANALSDISPLPPTRCHRLKGDRKNQFAIDLKHPHRLIITPLTDELEEWDIDSFGLDEVLKNTRAVKIMEVSNHYD